MSNPFNPFFSIFDKTSGFGNKAVIFSAIALISSKFSLELAKIPFLNIDIPDNFSLPTSGIFFLLSSYFLFLFLINYFEEVASFENNEYIKIIDEMKESDEYSNLDSNSKEVIRSIYRKIHINASKWKFIGYVQTSINFLLPIVVCFYTLRADWNNIINTFLAILN
ncbi:MAG: hypothetical protein ABJM12_00850 [Ekhidna sp.]